MDNTSLSYLYSKARNRFAKIIYILLYLITLLSICIWATEEGQGNYKGFFIALIITATIFEAIKRAFYYVVLGTIKPKK